MKNNTSTPKYFVPMNQGSTLEHEGEIGRIIEETENGYMVDFGYEVVEKYHDQGYTATNKREANILVKAAKQN